MSEREAPWVFVTYAHDSEQHKDQVREFATFLRKKIGLDVKLDQWDDNWRRDWSAWALENLIDADFIVVIASPDYKRRADGKAPPEEGRGAQFEASIIRDHMTKNLAAEVRRVLPVVLPGRTVEDVPTFLAPYSTTRFHVDRFTVEGVAELVAAMTGVGKYPTPERGVWLGGATSEPGEAAETPPAPRPARVPLGSGMDWLGSSASVRRGRSVIDGVLYDDSIVLRPTSAAETLGFVEIDLAERYSGLAAVAGVPDDAEPFQVGCFRVFLDGRPQPERTAGFQNPVAIDLDVTGVRRLRLEMYRQGTGSASLPPGAMVIGGRSGRLPNLAWGNPTLF